MNETYVNTELDAMHIIYSYLVFIIQVITINTESNLYLTLTSTYTS